MYLKTRGTNEAGGLKPCLLHNDCALDWEPNFPSLLLFLFGITLRCWHSTWWCGQGRAAEYSRAVCTLVCMRYPCTEISPTDHQWGASGGPGLTPLTRSESWGSPQRQSYPSRHLHALLCSTLLHKRVKTASVAIDSISVHIQGASCSCNCTSRRMRQLHDDRPSDGPHRSSQPNPTTSQSNATSNS